MNISKNFAYSNSPKEMTSARLQIEIEVMEVNKRAL